MYFHRIGATTHAVVFYMSKLSSTLCSTNSRIALMHPSVSFNTSFSQKWITYQSCALRALSSRISRAIFSSILAIQYSRLRFSLDLRSSQFCPCQNSPSTKMAILYFRMAISGEPGSRLSFNLYLNPRCHSRLARSTSALPCFRWTRDIRLDVSGVVSYDFGCFMALLSAPQRTNCSARSTASS